MNQKYIIAVDSFKGCLTTAEAGMAVAEALHEALGDVETVCLPMSDGGEGMAEAFTTALGGSMTGAYVHDPMMRRVWAEYGLAPDGTAVIEVAKACGLTLLDEEERNPLRATSYGVGELVAAGVKRGCRRFIIGLGGSGTSDAGIGMLKALTNPLLGANGATAVFARQKGATPEMMPLLERRAMRFAKASAMHFGFDRSCLPGAGAAGGLGYAFMQYLSAVQVSGADLLLDLLDFDSKTDGATAVITGEGHADRQTLMGKLPVRVMERARQRGVPTWLLAGRVENRDELIGAGFAVAESVTPDGMDLDEAMRKETAMSNMASAVRKLTSRLPYL